MIAAGMHREPHTVREGINAAATKLAGEGADGAMVGTASPFFILLTTGCLARRFSLLPVDMDVEGAVR
ncbi:hypothetical protein AFCDBAGC_3810 [Methylobacterium cerastii]|uniref:Asp/Glu racemase n=1 Tax=Methylobacterium cerastii TaxID=932741 RepID=A0ABQ4QL83_9HYPH|nr:hypothetical protein AFCDBAGC_3810 [Methylobacterium cerastii]